MIHKQMDFPFSIKGSITTNKKTELSQRWPRDAPNIWVPWWAE